MGCMLLKGRKYRIIMLFISDLGDGVGRSYFVKDLVGAFI